MWVARHVTYTQAERNAKSMYLSNIELGVLLVFAPLFIVAVHADGRSRGREEEQQVAVSLFNLGMAYMTGEDDLPEDPDRAILYLRMAADRGHVRAPFVLGLTYYHGQLDFGRDHKKAYFWFDWAAANLYMGNEIGKISWRERRQLTKYKAETKPDAKANDADVNDLDSEDDEWPLDLGGEANRKKGDEFPFGFEEDEK